MELGVQFLGETSGKDQNKRNCIAHGKPTDLTKSWPAQRGALEQRLFLRLSPLTEQKHPGPSTPHSTLTFAQEEHEVKS